MAKRKAPAAENYNERWLITYADVLTLMFVLFMVLFSISVVNTAKFDLLKESLRQSLSGGLPATPGGESILAETGDDAPAPISEATPSQIAPEAPAPTSGVSLVSASPAQALESQQLESAETTIDAAAEKAGLQSKIETTVNERGLTVRLEADGILFASGSATLEPSGRRLLGSIASAVGELPNPVRVEGHTDNRPIGTRQFPSNWELAGSRAAAVVRYMIGRHIPPGRLQNVGFADTRPLASNASEAGRSQNRRVEIVVLRLQGAPGQGPAEIFGGLG